MAILELPDELINTLSHLARNRNLSVDLLIQQLLTRDATFENSMDGMLIAGDNMQYVDVNPTACELLGYTRDELLQKSVPDISSPTEQTQTDWDTFGEDGRMRGEYSVRHKDGHEILIEFVAVNNVTPGHHVSIFRDITTRKMMESQLIESEKRFKAFMDNAPMVAYIKDAESNYLFTNAHMRELTFSKDMSFEDSTPYEHLPEQVAHNIQQADQKVLNEQTIVEMEEYVLWEDHDPRWFKEIKFPVVGVEDTIHVGGFAIDITSLKEAEDQFRLREQFISQIADTLPGMVYVYDVANRRDVYSNRRAAQFLGYQVDELQNIYTHFTEVVHPDDREKLNQHFDDLRQADDDVILENTYRMKHRDGHWRWFNSRDKVAKRDAEGNVIHIMGIALDVTETEQLKAEQQHILDRSPIPIAISNTDRQVEYHNDAFIETFGYAVNDTPDIDTWRKLAYPDPDYRQKTFRLWGEDIQTARETNNVIPARLYRIIDKSGEEHTVSIQASIVGNRIISTFVDMTEEQRMKQAIIESEYRYRALFENALYSIAIYDLDGRIQMINQKAAETFGHEPDDMIGHLLEEFYPNSHERMIAFINKVVANNAITTVEDEIEIGGKKQILWSVAQPVYDSNGHINSVQVATHNVTAQRQAETFQQQQKQLEIRLEKERQISDLRTRLLTTISHEFRTPLAVIQTNTEMLMRYRDRLSLERQDQKLNQIIAQIRHLIGMLDNVRTMSKAQQSHIDYQPSAVDLSEFIDSIRENFEATKIDTQVFNIKSEIDNDKSIFDKNLIKQALMNLLSNASKYSPEDSNIWLVVLKENGILTFTVEDEGIGIARNDLQHIYQPFYRGKNAENMRGTGLGLPIVREIVDLHRGTVTCNSQLNQGTTFTIQLSENLV